MIYHKLWVSYKRKKGFTISKRYTREGWFLFGLIPLYIRTIKID